MNQILNTIKGTGRRKSSVARVELTPGTGQFQINKKLSTSYMHKNTYLMVEMQAPLEFLQLKNKFNINISVYGGGLVGQAQAIKLGIARALCTFNDSYRNELKLKGYLTRDARVKERKKYGLKKARKAPQFSKR